MKHKYRQSNFLWFSLITRKTSMCVCVSVGLSVCLLLANNIFFLDNTFRFLLKVSFFILHWSEHLHGCYFIGVIISATSNYSHNSSVDTVYSCLLYIIVWSMVILLIILAASIQACFFVQFDSILRPSDRLCVTWHLVMLLDRIYLLNLSVGVLI